MKNTQNLYKNIKFEGSEKVLNEIDRLNHTPSLREKISSFLNKEIEVSLSTVLVSVVCCSLIYAGSIDGLREEIRPYSITVVDERGNYEIY